MTDIKTKTVVGKVADSIGGLGFGQLAVEIDGTAMKLRVQQDVLVQCGFATTQFKPVSEVQVTVEQMGGFWVTVSVNKIGDVTANPDEAKLAEVVQKMRDTPVVKAKKKRPTPLRAKATIKSMNDHTIYLTCEGRKDLRLKMPLWNKFDNKKVELGIVLDVSFHVTDQGNNVVNEIHGVVAKEQEKLAPMASKPVVKRDKKKPQPKKPEVFLQAIGCLGLINLAEGKVWLEVQYYRIGDEVLRYRGDNPHFEVEQKCLPQVNFDADEIIDFYVVKIGDKFLATDLTVNVDCQPEEEPEIVDDGQGELFGKDGGNIVDIKSAKG